MTRRASGVGRLKRNRVTRTAALELCSPLCYVTASVVADTAHDPSFLHDEIMAEAIQAIAGVAPSAVHERLIMEVWPSIASTALGRQLGSLYSTPIRLGPLHFSAVLGVLTAPIPILLYFLPNRLFRRYTLTNRRVIIRNGPQARDGESVALDDLTDARLVTLPGQSFYNAADLELVCGDRVGLCLRGVPSPEPFRRAILKARDARVHVASCCRAEEAIAPQAVPVPAGA